MPSGELDLKRTRYQGAVYHRQQSPTQTRETAIRQGSSGEIWGSYDRVMGGLSPIPSVDAFVGPLPDNVEGIEFTTDVPPDRNTPPSLRAGQVRVMA